MDALQDAVGLRARGAADARRSGRAGPPPRLRRARPAGRRAPRSPDRPAFDPNRSDDRY
ncbi:MAG: hypothetical protein WKG07_18350 [Hymenobacter sp.]